MNDPALVARLKRLEDVEAIERLKTMYCFHCDDGFDPEAIAALFCEDGVWDGGSRVEGRGPIRGPHPQGERTHHGHG